MSYYVIGIGGTGAKCIEALVHLAAAGMMPTGDLHILYVDPDTSNGSLKRSMDTLQYYLDCKKSLKLGNIDFMKTNIPCDKPTTWSPFENLAESQLDNFFHYNALRPEEKNIFNVLYSPEERQTSLERGFRGHPSIGSAVMASRISLGTSEPWQTLINKMENDMGEGGSGAKIFLIGSIFGGTGSSGFPTIARLIYDRLEKKGKENMKIGGVLLLPYFSFTPDSNNKELRAGSEYFLMTTQVALKYYHQKGKTDIYDAVYLLGNDVLASVDFSTGADTQRNDPHFIELCSALAAIDFFNKEKEKATDKYYLLARKEQNQLDWSDMPDGNNGDTIRQKINHLTRFAFAYLNEYAPTLENIKTKGKQHRYPWYVSFFEREKLSMDTGDTRTIKSQLESYCQSLLLWLSKIQVSAKDQQINLINYNAIDNKRLEDFDNLVLPLGKGNRKALTKLFDRMCDAKVTDTDAEGFGKFVHALYTECGKG